MPTQRDGDLDREPARDGRERGPLIRVAVSAPLAEAENLRARFVELAPEGFEESERAETVELAAYGEAAACVLAVFPDARRSEVEDGWEERWREFHRPVTIGPLWVGAPWELPPAGALAVVVDPGRAFGTGAHPSTHLCLELLLTQQRGAVIDIGCGSGVLAIAAARLGFAPVIAVDVDELAVEISAENARANGVEIETRVLDARSGELPQTALVVANISLEAIEQVGRRLTASRAITAGYLAGEQPELPGYRQLERRERGGWAADLLARNENLSSGPAA